MLEIIDKGLTTRAHETPLLFVHGDITRRGAGTSASRVGQQRVVC
jgi:hypothetical protein